MKSFFGFGLLVEQKKQFEDITSGSGRSCWAFFTFSSTYNQLNDWLIKSCKRLAEQSIMEITVSCSPRMTNAVAERLLSRLLKVKWQRYTQASYNKGNWPEKSSLVINGICVLFYWLLRVNKNVWHMSCFKLTLAQQLANLQESSQ